MITFYHAQSNSSRKEDLSQTKVFVMIDLVLLVASHWISWGEFLKTMDHNEEGKNTEGQYNDQDL